MPERDPNTVDVEFENVQLIRATTLSPNKKVELSVMIQRSSGHFEIAEENSVVVTGTIRHIRNARPIVAPPKPTSDCLLLDSEDFYRELRLRGYTYENEFRAVQSARADGRSGAIRWSSNNWATCMDNMLQVSMVSTDTRSLILPTSIRRIRINAREHMECVERATSHDETSLLDVFVHKEMDSIVCGGIEITGFSTNAVARRKQVGIEAIDRYQFVPLDGSGEVLSAADGARVCSQLIADITKARSFKLVEVHNTTHDSQVPAFEQAFLKIPQIFVEFQVYASSNLDSVPGDNVQVVNAFDQQTDIVVLPDEWLNNAAFMEKASSTLAAGSFMIAMHQPRDLCLNDLSPPSGYQSISLVKCQTTCLHLMRKNASLGAANAKAVVPLKTSDTEFEWLKKAQELSKSQPVVIVSEQESFPGVLGLVKCILKEPMAHPVQCIEIRDSKAPKFDVEHGLYAQQLRLELPFSVYCDGKWGTYHHLTLAQPTRTPSTKEIYTMQMQQIGNFSSLAWRDSTLPPRKTVMKVHYAPINFRDTMTASGKLSPEIFTTGRLQAQNFLGLEFAGVAADGRRLIGLKEHSCISTHVGLDERDYVWEVPEKMSLRDASTIPIIYSTVYYAFFIRASIRAGQSILIHAGSGGVGMGAIRIALAYGLDVYTTVSNEAKKSFILDMFPKLKRSQIGNSRDCTFERMIMESTDGRGVDFVLNSLSDDKLHASIRCLAQNGTFLEIGKFDIFNDTQIGMLAFAKEASFVPIFTDRMFTEYMADLFKLVERDLQRGIIQPIPSTVFAPNDLEQAFKYLGSGKHVGKVVIQVRDEQSPEQLLPLKVLPRTLYKPNRSYVIVGGLGDFGLEFIDWMVLRGARRIVVSSRRQPWSSYQKYRIR